MPAHQDGHAEGMCFRPDPQPKGHFSARSATLPESGPPGAYLGEQMSHRHGAFRVLHLRALNPAATEGRPGGWPSLAQHRICSSVSRHVGQHFANFGRNLGWRNNLSVIVGQTFGNCSAASEILERPRRNVGKTPTRSGARSAKLGRASGVGSAWGVVVKRSCGAGFRKDDCTRKGTVVVQFENSTSSRQRLEIYSL